MKQEIQITGLPLTEDIAKTTLLFVRNPEDGTGDKRATVETIERKLGSSSVFGFIASVADINKIELTNANGGFEIESYRNGMIVSFISPLTSTGLVSVNIGSLPDKELKVINTTDSAVVVQNDYIEAIYIGDPLTGKFYVTNTKVESKKISDLTEVSTFAEADFIAIHKNGATVDNKLSKTNLVKELGNSAVYGFNASSPSSNKITLVSANGGAEIIQYKEDMIVKFISPITTTAMTTIKVGNLGEIQLRKLNSTDYAPVSQNTVVEAIYKGGYFYRTNIPETTIFTNEYNATAVVNAQRTLTTYTLTSAIGATKTQYYKGMWFFTISPLDSAGVTMVNIDGLGLKQLTDPDGDPVPFDFYKDQPFSGTYDGTKFIRHIFASEEPEQPQPDPLVPPQDIVITVNPTDILQNIYNKVVQDYGENGGGRKVVLNLPPTSTGQGTTYININKNTPWITIKGNDTQVIYTNTLSERGNITFSGTFVYHTPFIQGSNTNEVQSVTFKDCKFSCTVYAPIISYPNYINITAQNCEFVTNNLASNNFFIDYQSQTHDSRSNIILDNVKFTNFYVHIINSGNTIVKNLTHTGALVSSTSTGYTLLLFFRKGTYTIDNLQLTSFVNNNQNYREILRLTDCSATISNSKMTASGTHPTTAIAIYSSKITINSGDYRQLNATSTPDILVYGAGSILYRKPEVLGVSQAVNGGVIQNI